jgi:ribosomal protein S18 acetylase RimI-like enzyme
VADAGEHDLPELARLMASSPLLARYRVDLDGALASLRAAHREGDTLLAAWTDSLVGMAWLSFAPRIFDGAAYLRLLLVDGDAQHQGIGRQLLGAVEVAARERANHLYLLATVDNVRARAFYERHDYRQVGDLPGLVWPDLDEALYHKPLRAHAERLSG